MDDVMICSDGVDISGVPEEIKILPMGKVHSQKGDFIVDSESVRLMKEEFLSRKLELPIDYEHQTLQDVQAPAAGWIEDFYEKDNAVVAKVKWTEKGKEYLKNREYRYLSPVVFTHGKNGRAFLLHSAALTNKPAIDGMFAIINKSLGINETTNSNQKDNDGGNEMDLKKMIEALGLPETATEEDVLKAIANLRNPEANKEGSNPDGKEMVANKTVLGLLELPEDAKTEDVTAQIMKYKAGDTGLQAEIKALKEKFETKEANEAVQRALKDGKISAAQSAWATQYALKDPTGFSNFVAAAPCVVPMGKANVADAPVGMKSEDVDPMVLKACGVSAEDLKKYADKEEK